MTTIMPAWIKEQSERGVVAILGSEPPTDAIPQFVPRSSIERVVVSEHEINGMRFGILILRHDVCTNKEAKETTT